MNGFGNITGNLSAGSGAIVSPGIGGGSLGTLNVSISATFAGRVVLEINKANVGITNDQINSGGPMLSGGILTVTNVGPALQAGDTFKLLAASTFLSGFNFTLDLADPGAGLVWNTNNLYVDGTLSVSNSTVTGPTTNASITKATLSGTNLIVHGTNNNVPNTSFHYVVLTTTNIATPLANWIPVVTNSFNADGTFDYTAPILPGTPRQFIDVKVVP